MTIQVELSVEAEPRLASEAQAHGVDPEEYVGGEFWDACARPKTQNG